MIIHEMEQQTPEWFAVKLGKLSSTSAAPLLVNGKSESGLGAGAITNLYAICGEIITGESLEFGGNKATERGNDLEPLARQYYEDQKWVEVKEVGFIEYDEYRGCSPDGLVGEYGLIEIKCLYAKEFLAFAETKKITPAYFNQIQWQLYTTGRKWCDYIVYHPKFANPATILRVERDEKIITKYKEKSEIFIKELNKLVEAYSKVA